tara:strand:+ start:1253 stop:1528 length:276 start_codon:yes stop_codon:yes gene_type:complete
MKYPPIVHTFVKAEDKPDLKTAQELVGGNVELIVLSMEYGSTIQLLVNEEGLLKNMEYNPVATELVLKYRSTQTSPIVGPAIVLSGKARWD